MQAQPTSRHQSIGVPVLPPVAQPAVSQAPKPPVNDLLGDLGGDPFAQPAGANLYIFQDRNLLIEGHVDISTKSSFRYHLNV